MRVNVFLLNQLNCVRGRHKLARCHQL